MIAFVIGLYLAFGAPTADGVHAVGGLLAVWEFAWFLAAAFGRIS